MRTLVLFDFDGTLYKKDSLLEFTKFYIGKTHFYIGMLMISPYLIGMKLGMISNENTKKKFVRYFFKNADYEKFKQISTAFSMHKIDPDLNEKLYAKFINHIDSNHSVYIVTASFPEWIEPWSRQFGVGIIGTQIAVKDKKLLGSFISKNCYGQEKVNRIKEILDISQFDKIYVYGKGKGDLEMLQLSK